MSMVPAPAIAVSVVFALSACAAVSGSGGMLLSAARKTKATIASGHHTA